MISDWRLSASVLSVLFVLSVLLCAGCAPTTGPGGALRGDVALTAAAGKVNQEAASVSGVADDLRGIATEVEKPVPAAAPKIRAGADSLSRSSATLTVVSADLAALAALYTNQETTIGDLQKKLAAALDSARARGNWIFYIGIALGLLGCSGSVYAAFNAPSKKLIGLAAASVFLASVSLGLLRYGKPFAIGGLVLTALMGVGALVALALNFKGMVQETRGLWKKTMDTFDKAEVKAEKGMTCSPSVLSVKSQWAAEQATAGIADAVAAVRGKEPA